MQLWLEKTKYDEFKFRGPMGPFHIMDISYIVLFSFIDLIGDISVFISLHVG